MAQLGISTHMIIFKVLMLAIIIAINYSQLILFLNLINHWTYEHHPAYAMLLCPSCQNQSNIGDCQNCDYYTKRYYNTLHCVKSCHIPDIIAFLHSIGKQELICDLRKLFTCYENNTFFKLYDFYAVKNAPLYHPYHLNLHQSIHELNPEEIPRRSISLGRIPGPRNPEISLVMKSRVVDFLSTLNLSQLKHFALKGINIPESDFTTTAYITLFCEPTLWSRCVAESLMFTWEILGSHSRYPLYSTKELEKALDGVNVCVEFD